MNRTERNLWASARTLPDLAELTAQWLEGRIKSQPGYADGWGPDEETLPHVPVLAAANRAGFLTCNSQSADGRLEAWVTGFVSDEALARLRVACGWSSLILSGRRGREHFGDCHSRLSARAIRLEYPGDCLAEAWLVTIVDPEPGRNDLLWPALAKFAGLVRSS